MKYSLKLGKVSIHRYPVGQKFCQNRFILHSFRDTSIFEKNLKIQNGRHFSQVKYSLKLGKASLHRYPVNQNVAEIALSRMVFEIQAFLCFAIFAKNSKIQNGRHF